ncbi:MAG: hypothetical protein PHO20_02090 [Candidatus Peribacteraceae bacterium]|nr:hypothetical protein [Candidatus Peribacteraceae bacterium]MDD5739534.1 hypothetical protein [Candidatus Peribacteraceae bacterium]
MQQPSSASPEFAIFKPEAARGHADHLLSTLLATIRTGIEHCLRAVPEPAHYLTNPIRVGDQVFHIPAFPNMAAQKALQVSLVQLIGDKPFNGLRRSQVDDSAIAQFPELFAALFAWEYLHPESEWKDVICHEPTRGTCGEQYPQEVFAAFQGLLHGSEESGIRFQNGERQLCFNPAYQGRVARVVADCLGVATSELCNGQEPAAVAQILLKKFPNLRGLSQQSEDVLEAMVAVLQGKESPA